MLDIVIFVIALHPLNAYCPIDVPLPVLEIDASVNDVHDWNAYSPTVDNLPVLSIVAFVIFVHDLNALFPIDVNGPLIESDVIPLVSNADVPIVNEDAVDVILTAPFDEHDLNALFPIDVIAFPNITLFRLIHPTNVESPMAQGEFSNVTVVNPMQLSKTLFSNVSTDLGIDISEIPLDANAY